MSFSTRLNRENRQNDFNTIGHALFGQSRACADSVSKGKSCREILSNGAKGKHVRNKKYLIIIIFFSIQQVLFGRATMHETSRLQMKNNNNNHSRRNQGKCQINHQHQMEIHSILYLCRVS